MIYNISKYLSYFFDKLLEVFSDNKKFSSFIIYFINFFWIISLIFIEYSYYTITNVIFYTIFSIIDRTGYQLRINNINIFSYMLIIVYETYYMTYIIINLSILPKERELLFVSIIIITFLRSIWILSLEERKEDKLKEDIVKSGDEND